MGVAAIALLATACGAAGGGKGAIVAKCIKDGESQKVCQCMADKVEKAVDKDVFRAMVMEAEGKVEESQKLLESLPMEKQMTAMGALSALECMSLK
jgi:hypothetical protein